MTQLNAIQHIRPALQDGNHIPTLAVVLIWTANVITIWSHRLKSRKVLAEMDESQLRDVGLTRAQAEQESLKRFWMS